MKMAFLIICACAAIPASAQPVYKCSSPQGATSYQSTPCAAGETSARRQHAAPTMGASATTTVVPAATGQRRVQVRYTTTAANEKCDSAKAMRTAALGAAGSAATAELRARLDRDIQSACR